MPTAIAPSPTVNPTPDLVESLYIRWLQGDSLRKLSAMLGGQVSYSAIHSWLRRQYGDQATNPVSMSLARSILEDYVGTGIVPDTELIGLALSLVETPETLKHRSHHSLNMLGQFQVVREASLLDILASSTDDPLTDLAIAPDPWDFLRLPLAIATWDLLVAQMSAWLARRG